MAIERESPARTLVHQNRSLPLTGRVALVTGGAQGIGRGIASELLATGATVVIGDLFEAEMSETARELGPRGLIDWVRLDVSDPASSAGAVAEIERRYGAVDVLVNNAGIAKPGLFAEIDPKALEKVLQVDLAGAVHLTRLVLPRMIERRWGRIVNISSMMAFAATPGFVLYSTAKAGLLGFSESLERELRRIPDLRVTVVLPPSVRTQSFAEAKQVAPALMRWKLVPPVSVEQVARRTAHGLIEGRRRIYCGAQSARFADQQAPTVGDGPDHPPHVPSPGGGSPAARASRASRDGTHGGGNAVSASAATERQRAPPGKRSPRLSRCDRNGQEGGSRGRRREKGELPSG
jgi:NAD(P)-dependent dehydrogenase (short-subunit alcohol dehydrogenase family)